MLQTEIDYFYAQQLNYLNDEIKLFSVNLIKFKILKGLVSTLKQCQIIKYQSSFLIVSLN